MARKGKHKILIRGLQIGITVFLIAGIAVVFPMLFFPKEKEKNEWSEASATNQEAFFPIFQSSTTVQSEETEVNPSETSAVPETTPTESTSPPTESTLAKLLEKKSRPAVQVALTFDDGPGAYTEQLLDILKEYDVSVTFFVQGGQAKGRPELIQRMMEEGHTVANHSYSHKNLGTGVASRETIQQEIGGTDDVVVGLGLPVPPYFRPPYGSYNQAVRDIAARPVLLWNVDPRDWEVRDASVVQQRVIEVVKDGDIVLLHDVHLTTVEAMPGILDVFAERGIEVVSLEELLSRDGNEPQAGSVYSRGKNRG